MRFQTFLEFSFIFEYPKTLAILISIIFVLKKSDQNFPERITNAVLRIKRIVTLTAVDEADQKLIPNSNKEKN